MTVRSMPRTEAGRKLLGRDLRTLAERRDDRGRNSPGWLRLRDAILAIEAETAEQALDELVVSEVKAHRREKREAAALSDAGLREAAERLVDAIDAKDEANTWGWSRALRAALARQGTES